MLKFFYALFLLLFWTQTSFAQLNYAPNNIHIPALNKRYDGDVVLGISQGSSFQGFEIQGCFAPVKHLVIAAHYLASGNNGNITPNSFGAKYRFQEAAIGFYQPIRNGSFTLLSGFGGGKVTNAFGQDRYSKLYLNRFFLQPGIHIRKGLLTTAGAIRLHYLSFPSGQANFAIDENNLYAIKALEKESPLFVPELGMQSGIYLRPFHISLNFNAIFAELDDLDFSLFNIGLFVGIDLGELTPEKSKKTGNK